MSHIPINSFNMSLFSLDTGFDSVAGTIDPTYNPRILSGSELHQFFTRQIHISGKYIDGITVDTNGIVLPQGYMYVLDPYLYYSSGTTWRNGPYFIWDVDGVDQDHPRWSSHYAAVELSYASPDENNKRGYRGLKYLDCSLSSKTLKIKALGPWSAMGNVYFDNQQTNAVITSTHKSHILIHAIPSVDVVNQTVRQLDTAWTTIDGFSQTVDAVLLGTVTQIPNSALNKYLIFNRLQTTSYTTPTSPQTGDWLGVILTNNNATYTMTLSCATPTQTLLSAVDGLEQQTCFMWTWTGIRWVEIPFSSQGLVKLPRA
jgi:hypothetical protein